jgi:hypothetical protein
VCKASHNLIEKQQGVGSSTTTRRFHSGVYTNANEKYAGAFFSSKSRFLASEFGITGARYPEDIIFKSIELRQSCKYCENFLTRDYLDFSVEHLSSTTNVLNAIPLSTKQKRDIFDILNTRLDQQIYYLKHSSSSKKNNIPSSSTLGIIGFSENEANYDVSSDEVSHQQSLRNIRQKFFKMTVYSLLRYFSNVVVYVAKSEDKEKVLNWSLPLLGVFDMSDVLIAIPKKLYFHQRPVEQLLPKYALLDVAKRLRASGEPSSRKEWRDFNSIYYTEGDQVLHLRKLKYFYRLFDASDGNFLFIPHRLQVRVLSCVLCMLPLSLSIDVCSPVLLWTV